MADPSLRSGEDVEAILKIALRQESGSIQELRDRLNRSAEELGISPDALAKAEAQYLQESKIDAYMQAKKIGFRSDLIVFAAVMTLLNVIYALTMFGKFYWPAIVFFAWGIAVITQLNFSRQRPNVNDPGFQAWLRAGEPTKLSQEDIDKLSGSDS